MDLNQLAIYCREQVHILFMLTSCYWVVSPCCMCVCLLYVPVLWCVVIKVSCTLNKCVVHAIRILPIWSIVQNSVLSVATALAWHLVCGPTSPLLTPEFITIIRDKH